MKNMTFEGYREALEGAGPKLKELILERASNDTEHITFPEFLRLVQYAYPETSYGWTA